MQKIIIKNFGAIKYAEIEIKKTLVLIGEQASGKSTIAKLIYFFKTIKDDLFSQIYRDKNHSNLEPYSDIVYPTRQKFQNFFGSTSRFSDFEIIFYYSIEKDKFLKLTIDENKTLRTNFSPNLLNNDNFKTSASSIKRRIQQRLNENNIRGQLQLFDEEEKIRYAQQLYTLLNESFESNQTNSLFIIAGRNATLSYSDLFEKYLFASISEDDRNEISERNKRKIQTIDETLMLQFMKNVVNTKDTFKKFGNFEGLIDDNAENKAKLYLIKNRINEILKGEYIIDEIVDADKMKNKTANPMQHILGKYEEQDVILKKGKYGLYITWGNNTKPLKELGNRPIESITYKDVEKYLSEGSNIIRNISDNITIRKGEKGDYIFFKTKKMKKPSFYSLKDFKSNYKDCKLDELKMWLKNVHNIF